MPERRAHAPVHLLHLWKGNVIQVEWLEVREGVVSVEIDNQPAMQEYPNKDREKSAWNQWFKINEID
jgi:hypothetical protein